MMPKLPLKSLALLIVVCLSKAVDANEQLSVSLPTELVPSTRTFEEAVGLERDGYYDAALAAYADFLATGGANLRPEALWRTAQLHDRSSQKSEAATFYFQLLAEFPTFDRSADALLNLAQLEADLGNLSTATNRHKEVLEKFPQSPQADEAAYWLALAAADGKDSDAARRYINSLLDLADSVDEVVSEQSKLLRAQAACLKCQLAAQEDQWYEISEFLNSTNWEIDSGPTFAQLAFWEAEAKFRLGHYNSARQKFEALKLLVFGVAEPWIPIVHLRRAQLAARQQQWKRVSEIISEIDAAYPEFELAYEADYLRGRALAGRGQMSEARQAYQAVLNNELTNGTETAAMAQWMIGETYFLQHDYEHAQTAYQNVLLDHQYPEWQAKAALKEGKCAELKGDWLEASELYQQALQNWNASEVAEQLASRLKWAQRQAILTTTTMRK
ncbi:tetratricopeptide repeat protein [Bythopirellula polymerisocia]|uniref:Tol-pal system protein YbgF n=1 Tax=Bythopirellula polymerisocia TaxID=2528003 RepID=A0A5C6CRJ2_9BACT|nr:tetratricopeptide repeat protein [Bythopirellula polymerisocia]TWU27533.1 tol-pal system protein YbgF [Bythopirellula polymerisocia]